MKELLKVARLAFYVLLLPLLATAGVSAYQWSSPQDHEIRVEPISSKISTGMASKREHSIRLDRYQTFTGKIWVANSIQGTQTGAAGLEVSLIQNGQVRYSTDTGESGFFSFRNVEPGHYALLAQGLNALSIHAIQVVPFQSDELAEARFETIAVTQRVDGIRQLLSQTEIGESPSMETDERPSLTKVVGNEVLLDNDGDLVGQVFSARPDSNLPNRILVMHHGKIVFDGATDQNGNFLIENMEPGFYDFVSTGPNGTTAFGFRAVSSTRQTSTFIETQANLPSVLESPLASNQDLFERVTQSDQTGPSNQLPSFPNSDRTIGNSFDLIGRETFVSPGGFGGAGFPVSTGLSTRAFLSGLGLFGILILVDDNDNPSNPPASPTS